MNTETPKIPASLEGFAKAAADLAESHGIKKFEMTVGLSFDDQKNVSPQPDWDGSIRVKYWSADGRGRPSPNIRVEYLAKMEMEVLYSPASTN